MDLKVMELLEKIYQTQTEMQSELIEIRTESIELRTEFKELNTEFKGLRNEFRGLETEFRGLRTEFKGLESELNEQRTKFRGLKTSQEAIAQNVTKIVTVVEHDIVHKIGVIFDFRKQQIDHNQKVGQALERIEAKVELVQLETSNLRRMK